MAINYVKLYNDWASNLHSFGVRTINYLLGMWIRCISINVALCLVCKRDTAICRLTPPPQSSKWLSGCTLDEYIIKSSSTVCLLCWMQILLLFGGINDAPRRPIKTSHTSSPNVQQQGLWNLCVHYTSQVHGCIWSRFSLHDGGKSCSSGLTPSTSAKQRNRN